MRDPTRIPKFLKQLEYFLNEDSDLTIGKLINVVGGDPTAYYLEEKDFIEHIEAKTEIELPEPEIIELELKNPSLIDLEKVWEKIPDLRFGQLICNITGDHDVLERVPDDMLVKAVEQYYGGLNNGD